MAWAPAALEAELESKMPGRAGSHWLSPRLGLKIPAKGRIKICPPSPSIEWASMQRFFCDSDTSVLVKLLWPPSRVICGLRVCKSLRSALESEATEILMQCRFCRHLSDLHRPLVSVEVDIQRLHLCTLDIHVSACGSLMNQVIYGLSEAQENGWSGKLRLLPVRAVCDIQC